MHPSSVYAKRSYPAGDACDLLVCCTDPPRRLVMILLPGGLGWQPCSPGLMGCDSSTVRRWIHRYQQRDVGVLSDRP
jgi:hypothetical protein